MIANKEKAGVVGLSNKQVRNLILFGLLFVGSFVAYYYLTQQAWWLSFMETVQQNLWWYLAFLVVVKVIGLVWPPLPGGILIMASVPIIGFQLAFATHVVGLFIGVGISYVLAWYYGDTLVRALLGEESWQKIHSFPIKKERTFEMVLLGRTLFGGISDIINYGAGLLRLPFWPFIGATLLSLLPDALTFYFIDVVAGGEVPKWWTIAPLVIAAFVFSFFFDKIKARYVEEKISA